MFSSMALNTIYLLLTSKFLPSNICGSRHPSKYRLGTSFRYCRSISKWTFPKCYPQFPPLPFSLFPPSGPKEWYHHLAYSSSPTTSNILACVSVPGDKILEEERLNKLFVPLLKCEEIFDVFSSWITNESLKLLTLSSLEWVMGIFFFFK